MEAPTVSIYALHQPNPCFGIVACCTIPSFCTDKLASASCLSYHRLQSWMQGNVVQSCSHPPNMFWVAFEHCALIAILHSLGWGHLMECCALLALCHNVPQYMPQKAKRETERVELQTNKIEDFNKKQSIQYIQAPDNLFESVNVQCNSLSSELTENNQFQDFQAHASF